VIFKFTDEGWTKFAVKNGVFNFSIPMYLIAFIYFVMIKHHRFTLFRMALLSVDVIFFGLFLGVVLLFIRELSRHMRN